MSGPDLRITRRRLPHWQQEGSIYFVTFRTEKEPLSHDELRLVVEHIKSGNGRFYCLLAAVVMPDHVHILIRPNEGIGLSRIMKGIKGVSAMLLNRTRRAMEESG